MENVLKNENIKKVKEVKETEKVFKETKDLIQIEIDLIPKLIVKVQKNFYKKTKTFSYELTIKFNNWFTKSIRLEELEYNHIVRKNNLKEKDEKSYVRLPVRVIKGTNKNGNNYMQCQVICSNHLFVSSFFSPLETYEFNDLGINHLVEIRSTILDDDLNKDF